MVAQTLLQLSQIEIPLAVRRDLLASVEPAKASGLMFSGPFDIHHVITRKQA